MNSKGQIQTQIFVYIMVLVVGAGILIYGYQAIKGFKTESDNVLFLQFKNTITNDLKSITFESIRTKNYDLPSSVQQVCFKSAIAQAGQGEAYRTTEENRQKSNGKNFQYPLIANEIDAGTQNNVFLYPRGERAFFGGVSVDLGQGVALRCFDVNSGLLKLTLTGQGATVLITE